MRGGAIYDEGRIARILDDLAVAAKAGFAAACAEWLFPSYERYARATGLGEVGALRAVLDGLGPRQRRGRAPRRV